MCVLIRSLNILLFRLIFLKDGQMVFQTKFSKAPVQLMKIIKPIVLQSLIWTLWQLRGTVISGSPSSRTWSTLGGSTSTLQGSQWLPTCSMTLICRWYLQKKLLKAFSGQWLLHSINNIVIFGWEYLYSSGQLVTVHMFDDINLQMLSAKETCKRIFWSMIAPQHQEHSHLWVVFSGQGLGKSCFP